MRRQQVASAVVASIAERRRRIEGEPLPRNIADLVAMASAEGGGKMLWDFFESGEKLTYAELKPRVFALAGGLMSQGIRKGTHVAIMLPNKAAFPLTWLAIGSIGAVMVPMNNSYSDREIAYVVGNSEATYVVVDDSCLEAVDRVIASGGVKVTAERVIVSGKAPAGRASLESLMQQDAGVFQPPEVGHDDLLNIQYTSGTTGFPKGCMLTQRYWISAGKVNAFRDGRTYRHILASTPFYYMDPQWLLLMAVYQRATLHVAFRQSASRFMDWVRELEIEFCLLPRVILKQPAHPDDRNNKIVRSNVYGISKAAHQAVEERFDLCAREAFGMTEIGPSMFMPIEATDMVGSLSCGIPCPFRECRVADEAGNTVPPGTVGELLVRGHGILKGYYNNPEATQKSFHGDWFRTGDLFRMDERGFFYIVGRIKDMIRRSGENIAAQEVEAVLNAFDAVAESAVVPVKDEMRGEELKAVIVWREGVAGNDSDVEALLEYCRHNLAPFKVPRYVQGQAELPKTPSGKIAKHRIVHDDGLIYDRVKPSHAKNAGAGHV